MLSDTAHEACIWGQSCLAQIAIHGMHAPCQEDQQRALRDPAYRGVVSTYVVAYWAMLLGSCHLAGGHPVPALALVGLVLSLGTGAGIMFAVAHELVHRRVRAMP